MPSVTIREMQAREQHAWLQMRHSLWPDLAPELLCAEADEILADPAVYAVFVAVTDDTEPVGFVEVSVRDWARGM